MLLQTPRPIALPDASPIVSDQCKDYIGRSNAPSALFQPIFTTFANVSIQENLTKP